MSTMRERFEASVMRGESQEEENESLRAERKRLRDVGAVDEKLIDGLARVLEKAWIEDDCKDYQDIARVALNYLAKKERA